MRLLRYLMLKYDLACLLTLEIETKKKDKYLCASHQCTTSSLKLCDLHELFLHLSTVGINSEKSLHYCIIYFSVYNFLNVLLLHIP